VGEDRGELLQGTLDMLVLRALALEPMHGWGLAQRLGAMSRGVFEVPQGTLYPSLQRLKRGGWVRSEWRRTENNRRARYYSITRSGELRLEKELAAWERSSAAVNAVLAWRGGVA